uniref:Uncharacterized protein n=1 Tax=Pararge aegeria TaxID=116150 RepID=S4PWA4_9NEOP
MELSWTSKIFFAFDSRNLEEGYRLEDAGRWNVCLRNLVEHKQRLPPVCGLGSIRHQRCQHFCLSVQQESEPYVQK